MSRIGGARPAFGGSVRLRDRLSVHARTLPAAHGSSVSLRACIDTSPLPGSRVPLSRAVLAAPTRSTVRIDVRHRRVLRSLHFDHYRVEVDGHGDVIARTERARRAEPRYEE